MLTWRKRQHVQPEELPKDPAVAVAATLRRLERSDKFRWARIALAIGVALSAFGLLASQNALQAQRLNEQQKELQSSCKFFRDLGSIRIPISTKPKPTKIGISIISDSIIASSGRDCGRRVKVDPTLSYWKRFYNIK